MFLESLWEEKRSNGLSNDLDVYDDLIKYTYRECTSSERCNFLSELRLYSVEHVGPIPKRIGAFISF